MLMNPSFNVGPHHRLLCDELMALERGDTDRLMVFISPRASKSLITSTYFPAWAPGRILSQDLDGVAPRGQVRVVIRRRNRVYARRRKAGMRHLSRPVRWIAPYVLQLEVGGEFLPDQNPRRRDAHRPHRFARHDAQRGRYRQFLELVRGDGIHERLELERVFAKGLHLPTRRTAAGVAKHHDDLLASIQETAPDL